MLPDRRSLAALLLVCGLLLCRGASAQRVQVEVLVFAYANPDAAAAMVDADADPVPQGMLLGSGGELYSALPDSSKRLLGAQAALARHARTRALAHMAWVEELGSARAVRIRGSQRLSISDPARGLMQAEVEALEGDLTLGGARGTALTLDLVLREALSDRAGRSAGLRRYRLQSSRVIAFGETHYFDHPAFGAIVRIDPIDSAQSTTPAPGAAP